MASFASPQDFNPLDMNLFYSKVGREHVCVCVCVGAEKGGRRKGGNLTLPACARQCHVVWQGISLVAITGPEGDMFPPADGELKPWDGGEFLTSSTPLVSLLGVERTCALCPLQTTRW